MLKSKASWATRHKLMFKERALTSLSITIVPSPFQVSKECLKATTFWPDATS